MRQVTWPRCFRSGRSPWICKQPLCFSTGERERESRLQGGQEDLGAEEKMETVYIE